jgi:hypothetical protein
MNLDTSEQFIDGERLDNNGRSVKEEEATKGNAVEYPHGLRLGLVMLALCFSVFLLALV